MANSRRTDTVEIAALMSATDREGRVDPLAYEAQRLILNNQRLGGIDAEALVRELQRSPGFKNFDKNTFLDAIDTRLDEPWEKRQLAEALDAANITDGDGERLLERVGGGISGVYEQTKEAGEWFDRSLSGGMSKVQRWSEEVSKNPNSSPTEREAASTASEVAGKAQFNYGMAKGAAGQAIDTLGDFVDLGKMAYRFKNDPDYRDTLIGMAKMYAADVAQNPKKPIDDARSAATTAIERWEDGLDEAKKQNREKEFMGGSAGAAGLELVAMVVPASKLGKFGKLANAIDRLTPDNVEEIGQVFKDVNRALKKGGDHEIGAELTMIGITESARKAGKLDLLVDAARKTGNIEGLLRSGMLNPKELGDILKKDKAFFEGKISYSEALDFNQRGVDFSKMNTRQLGDIGEARMTYTLVEKGYIDIVAIKNRSGHGIDLIGRNPKGELEFYEIKTSAKGHTVAQKGDPEDFIATRLERAINERGHWDPRNTIPGLKDIADEIQQEILRNGGKLNAKWVNMDVSHASNSHKLIFDIDGPHDWVKPAVSKKTSLLNESDNADFGFYQQAYAGIQEHDRKLGRASDQFSEQVAACLSVEAKCAGMKNIYHVVFNHDGTRVFAIDTPNIDAEWRRTAYADLALAGQQTIIASSEKMTQANDALLQQNQQAIQQNGPDDPNRNGPRIT